MDVELLFMEMKDHCSNQSTDPEISSSPTATVTTTKEELDIVQDLCQDAIKRRIKNHKNSRSKAELNQPNPAAVSTENLIFRLS